MRRGAREKDVKTTSHRVIASFKDLRVWQEGIELVKEVYSLCARLPKDELYGLASQMKRAALSVPSNISEGHSRNHRAEYRQCIYIAIGSLAELETQLFIRLRRRPRPWPGRNAALLLRRDVAPWRGGGCLAEARRAKAGKRVPRACPGGSTIKELSLLGKEDVASVFARIDRLRAMLITLGRKLA